MGAPAPEHVQTGSITLAFLFISDVLFNIFNLVSQMLVNTE